MDLQAVKQRFGIITNNEAMMRSLEVAIRVAPTDLSVLVTGESGVGKEFFPQVIHAYSSRKHSKYIAVNCGAIPEGTIDSELFGHEKNSFTGAGDARKGYFEEANGGTIFLDEVAELPVQTQARLLRVLQTGEFMRVGSSKTQKTNVRVVAATNVDLQQAVGMGRFREDLYYRLNAVPIGVPPLRSRPGDIHLLFRRFASDVAAQYRMPVVTLDESAKRLLEEYSWPGNVRQLKNVAEQISAVEQTRLVTVDVLGKYLPLASRVPIAVASEHSSQAFGDERELLYKVLFDMKSDINELKYMITELYREHNSMPKRELAGLLPESRYAPPTIGRGSEHSQEQFAPSEEITDEQAQELTKEQAQRDSITRALRRHNGKRREAARELFISERTLYRKIKELGIDEY